MTARRRSLPLAELRETLDLLREYGVPVGQCSFDIGPDGVKVSPPANQNAARGESLANYTNGAAHRPQKAAGR